MLFFSALNGSRKIGKPLSTQRVERLASTFNGNETEYLPKERVTRVYAVRHMKHNRNENWRRYVYLQRCQSH